MRTVLNVCVQRASDHLTSKVVITGLWCKGGKTPGSPISVLHPAMAVIVAVTLSPILLPCVKKRPLWQYTSPYTILKANFISSAQKSRTQQITPEKLQFWGFRFFLCLGWHLDSLCHGHRVGGRGGAVVQCGLCLSHLVFPHMAAKWAGVRSSSFLGATCPPWWIIH